VTAEIWGLPETAGKAPQNNVHCKTPVVIFMIRKLSAGKYRLYSRKKNPETGERRNLGTFNTRAAAEGRERAIQYFKHAK
jgi:hypothetical protein